MTIDDFEWQGELDETPPSRSRRRKPGLAGWVARLRQSVWVEPVARLAGMAALLGVLAAIGVVATTYAKPGKPLPDDVKTLALALGTSWLKPSAPDDVASAEPAPAAAAAPSKGGLSLASAPAPTPPAHATATAAPASAPADAVASTPGVLADGRVVLNAASAAELTRLPGVGTRRAEAIVALRTRLGRFKQPTDLLRVKGIGPRGLKRMLPHLVLDAPQNAEH